jgi:hypothetical protein
MLQTSAATDKIMADETFGSIGNFGAGTYDDIAGLRWNVYHGSSGTPVTVAGPTFSVSRTESFAADSSNPGNHALGHVAIYGNATGIIGSKAQPTGVMGNAQNSATGTHNGVTNNLDACGMVGQGLILGPAGAATAGSGGGGASIGAFFQAQSYSTVCRSIHAVEAMAWNLSGVDGTISGSGANTPSQAAIFCVLNGRAGGAAVAVENVLPSGSAIRWQVGMHFSASNGGAISESVIRDHSTCAVGLDLRGTYSTSAINLNDTTFAQAGGILFGGDIALYRSNTATLRCTGTFIAATQFRHLGTTLGFFNTAATTKATVTGSRGSNAALASLLTALANYGLITDSSS